MESEVIVSSKAAATLTKIFLINDKKQLGNGTAALACNSLLSQFFFSRQECARIQDYANMLLTRLSRDRPDIVHRVMSMLECPPE